MSISPLNFNGMIQSAHEVSNTQTHENQKSVVQQAQVSVEVEHKLERNARQVNETEDSTRDYRYDREGDGKGYQGNKQKHKKNNREDVEISVDGVVKKKSTASFDIRI